MSATNTNLVILPLREQSLEQNTTQSTGSVEYFERHADNHLENGQPGSECFRRCSIPALQLLAAKLVDKSDRKAKLVKNCMFSHSFRNEYLALEQYWVPKYYLITKHFPANSHNVTSLSSRYLVPVLVPGAMRSGRSPLRFWPEALTLEAKQQ